MLVCGIKGDAESWCTLHVLRVVSVIRLELVESGCGAHTVLAAINLT